MMRELQDPGQFDGGTSLRVRLDDYTIRKSLPHFQPIERSNQSTIIFLTVCTKDRKPILSNPSAHQILLKTWQEVDEWIVGKYVIMPDHIHLFCSPNALIAPSLRKWVFKWRSNVTRKWPNPAEKPIWQKDFFDRQMRSGQSYSEKWHYIRNNPVRAKLVDDCTNWPYQGELNTFRWHEAS